MISLDFELFWGMQHDWSLDEYEKNILGGRKAIPRMLSLFETHGIHATWATVGFMFAEDKKEAQKFFPDEAHMPTYDSARLLSYRCFTDVGENEQEAPCFFAPSIIKLISDTPGQEIGSHTFSHFYCREPGQKVEQFEADMKAAKAIAKDKGYELTSVILPSNQCEKEYVEILSKLGYTAYRDEVNDWIHKKVKLRLLKRLFRLIDVYIPLTGQGTFMPKYENGIWNLMGSRMYKPLLKPLFFLERMKMNRIKGQMLHAAKTGLIFHLWWHPHNVGVQTDFHMKQLNEICNYFDVLRKEYGMQSMNMREVVENLSCK